MDSITYAALIGIVFLLGIFVFTYFETPRRNFNRGIKKLQNIQVMSLGRSKDKSLTVPSENKGSSKNNDQDGLRIYVHEY